MLRADSPSTAPRRSAVNRTDMLESWLGLCMQLQQRFTLPTFLCARIRARQPLDPPKSRGCREARANRRFWTRGGKLGCGTLLHCRPGLGSEWMHACRGRRQTNNNKSRSLNYSGSQTGAAVASLTTIATATPAACTRPGGAGRSIYSFSCIYNLTHRIASEQPLTSSSLRHLTDLEISASTSTTTMALCKLWSSARLADSS